MLMITCPTSSSKQQQQQRHRHYSDTIIIMRRRWREKKNGDTMRIHRVVASMTIIVAILLLGMMGASATTTTSIISTMASMRSSPSSFVASSSSGTTTTRRKTIASLLLKHQQQTQFLGSGVAVRKSLATTRVANFAPSAAAAALSSSSTALAASTAASSAVPSSIISSSSSPLPPSNLAVSLDRPLLSPMEYTYRSTVSSYSSSSSSSSALSTWWSSFLTILLSDVLKTALVATLLAILVSYLPKLLVSSPSPSTPGGYNNNNNSSTNKAASPILEIFDSIYHRAKKVATTILSLIRGITSTTVSTTLRTRKKTTSFTTPMPFEGDGGWGKCTLRSKKVLGSSTSSSSSSSSSSFTIYEFALPESYYTIPLTLGQQLDFCCLSSNDDICTGSFYPLDGGGGGGDGEEGDGVVGGRGTFAGVVRVVLPNDKMADEGNSKFMEVLRNELRPGDEVAIKPGKSHLTYKGKHVPVTDVVYLAHGLGIVPILDQVRATLPRGSSSVRVSSVTWLNDHRQDFDIAMDDLEREYMKNPNKLAVSCILEEALDNPLEGNKEVEESVPYFNAGTMAVVAGPKRFAEKAKGYLMRRGYPENCICVLP